MAEISKKKSKPRKPKMDKITRETLSPDVLRAIDNAKMGIVHSMPMSLMHEIESIFGGKPHSYSCSTCILDYLRQAASKHNL